MTTRVLDARGQRCPLPIVLLARLWPSVPVGEEVLVVADDPAAAPDLAAWCRMRGQLLVGTEAAADGVPAYRVRRLG